LCLPSHHSSWAQVCIHVGHSTRGGSAEADIQAAKEAAANAKAEAKAKESKQRQRQPQPSSNASRARSGIERTALYLCCIFLNRHMLPSRFDAVKFITAWKQDKKLEGS
jgi:hypothetical protein